MRQLAAALFAVSCILSTSSAQQLETTIWLPDTLLGTEPVELAFDSASNTVYVAGPGSAVLTLDAANGRKLARIPLPGDPPRSARMLILDTDRRELYCFTERGEAYIIDCRAGRVVDSISTGFSRRGCYNSRTGKIYYARGNHGLVVIDCATHRIVDTVHIDGAQKVVCSPRSNRIYCTTDHWFPDTMYVVDGAADTIEAIIPGASPISLLYYSAGTDQVYCYGQAARSLSVFDCATNQRLAVIPLSTGETFDACADTSGKSVLVQVSESLFVIDGESHEVRARLRPGLVGMAMCYSAAADRFCVALGYWVPGKVVVIDPAGAVVGYVQLNDMPGSIVSADRFVYSGCPGVLSMIDPAACSIVTNIITITDQVRVCWDAATDIVCCVPKGYTYPLIALVDPDRCELLRWAWRHFRPEQTLAPGDGTLRGLSSGDQWMHVTGYDIQADTMLTILQVGIFPLWSYAMGFTINGTVSRVYCAGMDGTTMTYFLATADLDSGRHLMQARLGVMDTCFGPVWNPAVDKVYLAGASANPRLLIIDGTTGLPVRDLDLTAAGPVCCDPVRNRVFCFGSTLSVVTGDTDSVVAEWSVADSAAVDAACDPALGRVYGVVRDRLIACASPSGQPLYNVTLPTEHVSQMLCDTIAGTVYCLDKESRILHVVDGRSARLLTSIAVGRDPTDMTWVPPYRRVFVLSRDDSRLLVIRDTSAAAAEMPQSQSPVPKPEASIVRGVLRMGARPTAPGARQELLDAAGRTVMELLPGPNDVRSLSPGVYFVRASGQETTARVVVVR